MKKKIFLMIFAVLLNVHIFAGIRYYEDTDQVGSISVYTLLMFSEDEDERTMWNEFLALKKRAKEIANITGSVGDCFGNYYLGGIYKNSVFYQISADWYYNAYMGIGNVMVHRGKSINQTNPFVRIYSKQYTDFNLIYDDFLTQCAKFAK